MRGLDQDFPGMLADAPRRAIHAHADGRGRVQLHAAAIGQRDRAALAPGRAVVGRPVLPGQMAPGQPAQRRRGQGQHGRAQQLAPCRRGARAVERGHADGGGHGVEAALELLGALPDLFMPAALAAPARQFGLLGRAEVRACLRASQRAASSRMRASAACMLSAPASPAGIAESPGPCSASRCARSAASGRQCPRRTGLPAGT